VVLEDTEGNYPSDFFIWLMKYKINNSGSVRFYSEFLGS
jgi:hypothetical protein